MNTTINNLVSRNIKLYFKDKGTFFTSLLSPMILLVLFVTFLGSVYENSILSNIPEGIQISNDLVKNFTVSWLFSSLLGVSAVTVAFCSNIIMAQDKVNGAVNDLLAAPVKKSTLSISYFIANMITTLVVCFAVTTVGLIYISTISWYYTVADVALIYMNVFLAVLFGCSLSAVVLNFVSTQGGVGAVSSLISSLYGFVCGAYMPIAQFGDPIRNFISILPGTYSIGLLRTHYLGSVMGEMSKILPSDTIDGIKRAFDVSVYFSDNQVKAWQMYVVVGVTILVLISTYISINTFKSKKSK
ncbi:MAG: ABC transporter permease [Oscillospiraceae bacterium]